MHRKHCRLVKIHLPPCIKLCFVTIKTGLTKVLFVKKSNSFALYYSKGNQIVLLPSKLLNLLDSVIEGMRVRMNERLYWFYHSSGWFASFTSLLCDTAPTLTCINNKIIVKLAWFTNFNAQENYTKKVGFSISIIFARKRGNSILVFYEYNEIA